MKDQLIYKWMLFHAVGIAQRGNAGTDWPTIIGYRRKWKKIFWASPTICHILFGISYVLPTSKKICQVKKNSSPIVRHNSLAKSRYNLHQKPERETKLYLCPSTSWKLKSGTLLCYLFLFQPPTWLETTMPTARRACIFTRWRLVFSKLPKIAKPFAKLLEEYF